MLARRRIHPAVVATGALLFLSLAALFASEITGQQESTTTVISADGLIESKSGGFKFPDGSIQTTAAGGGEPCPTLDPSDEMIWVGGVCIDKYEASIWDAPTGGNQITGPIPCSRNGQDCDNIYARSVAGVQPRIEMTWWQAQQALANSGKRLPTNAEWQMAAAGTPDPGATPGSEDCNTNSLGAEPTGERENCVSRWGAHDMVGNLWEWVADWDEDAAGCESWPSEFADFGEDVSCVGRGDGDATTRLPGALLRGGSYDGGELAGPFAVAAGNPPSVRGGDFGFRGAR